MKQITLNINFGGFVGANKTLQFSVPDGYSESEIDEVAREEFENFVCESSKWEVIDVEEDEDTD